MSDEMDAGTPLLRVLRGRPSEDELAAVLVVLRARSAAVDPPAPATGAGWDALSRGVRRPLVPGPGAWQAAARW